MIKDAIVNLPLHSKRDVVTPFATSFAGAYGAHLTGIAFRYVPVVAAEVLGLADPHFVERQEAESKKAADEAVERLGFEIRREQVPWSSKQIECSLEAAPGKFAEVAHAFDLVIVGQAGPDGSGVDDLIVEAALFVSGRPTLIVPYIQTEAFRTERVAICWDGSRPAARAAADALALTKPNSAIHLVSILGERELRQEIGGIDMAGHLARHGHKVTVHNPMLGANIASTILNFVADNGIQFLVMGGYGHSRLREFVVGGVTRGILQSMTVPTLMSH